jgi:hypothetical protein
MVRSIHPFLAAKGRRNGPEVLSMVRSVHPFLAAEGRRKGHEVLEKSEAALS